MALNAQKTGSSFFVSKNSFVKAPVTKRAPNASKQMDGISGIILNNMKAQAGHIRQIKDLSSNPASRGGSHKANVRPGDQTTVIKKHQINPAGGIAAERFAPRVAPKIVIGAPLISKVGNGTQGGQIIRESGSQGRNQPPSIQQVLGGGSQGAIATS